METRTVFSTEVHVSDVLIWNTDVLPLTHKNSHPINDEDFTDTELLLELFSSDRHRVEETETPKKENRDREKAILSLFNDEHNYKQIFELGAIVLWDKLRSMTFIFKEKIVT